MDIKIVLLLVAVAVYFAVRYFLEKKKRMEVEVDFAIHKDKGALHAASQALGGELPVHPIPPDMLDYVGARPPYRDFTSGDTLGNTEAKDAIAREEEAEGTGCELSDEAGPAGEGSIRDSKGRIQ